MFTHLTLEVSLFSTTPCVKFQNSTNPEITWKSGIAKFFAKVNILGINSTYFLPLTMNVTKKLRKCNLFSILDNFLDPKFKKLSRIPKSTLSQFYDQIHIQWKKLSRIDTQYAKFGKTFAFSRVQVNSRKMPGMMEF